MQNSQAKLAGASGTHYKLTREADAGACKLVCKGHVSA